MKRVLVIGAGFLQDFVIRKARQMGYEVHALDADPNAIGFKHANHSAVINIVDEKSCLEYAKKMNIDGVLTAATDYGVLTAAYIAQELKLPGLKYNVAKLIKNKYLVRKCLFDNHVDDTEHAYEINEGTDLDTLRNSIRYPVMVKPCDGSGSRGASRVDGPEQLAEACQIAMNNSITRRAEIESFINGDEYGAESLVVNNEIHVLAIMKKWMTQPPYYAELGHAIPCGLPEEVEQSARKCIARAIRALGVNHGSVNMDILITKDAKIHIVDVGARMGGNMIGPCVVPYGTGIDYIGAMLQAALGERVDLTMTEHGCVATRLLAFDDGYVRNVDYAEEICRNHDVELYHHMVDGMHVHEYHTNIDGCGYIVAKGHNMEEAVDRVSCVLAMIKQACYSKA